MNYCKDCKWFHPGGMEHDDYAIIEYSLCKHPRALITSEHPVTGEYTIQATCSKMRGLDGQAGNCSDGELFEPKESE